MCVSVCVSCCLGGLMLRQLFYSRVFMAASAAQDPCYQGELSTWHQGKMCFNPFRLCLEIIVFTCVFYFSNHYGCKLLVRQVSLGNN